MENLAFMYTLVNKLFLAISEVIAELPDGQQWLERVIESLSRRVYYEFERDYYSRGNQATDYAQAWVRVLGKQGFLKESHYRFVQEDGVINVYITNGTCAYREYCRQAKREGTLFVCPRMTSIKWIIAVKTGQPYLMVTDEIDNEGVCRGRVYPEDSGK
ncbi:hypothetical protein [Syntrophothermus lipocalidus]|uniref:Uncharacterized protein n=1 Tax=Syntrophothermus lipocalidus (strain DSM 12680 / TGB-C1) TaxID=643648 RepID=D7CK75_SYNLT|nr:hypothetical protein [Syntrophothermus lipocalidus]ADI03059.1 hypothetical protein Slip_2320 [Syntrophothermus lipocalidus DSM 12680]